jgi:hypothetical protein
MESRSAGKGVFGNAHSSGVGVRVSVGDGVTVGEAVAVWVGVEVKVGVSVMVGVWVANGCGTSTLQPARQNASKTAKVHRVEQKLIIMVCNPINRNRLILTLFTRLTDGFAHGLILESRIQTCIVMLSST